ncbi:beta-ketoacyl synthase [Rhodococcus sp. EPR-157]|uniref:ketosynthase chain-length factor n=1 Tax=Rhodococcus sp. EPR-157 TaxID=1813677 RepID=UPI0007BAE3CE|nr:ketosynthase chain-length factor [Rhodococcus sp. EPR-157]KZE99885.1 beta-ketoacyl synthase [Rhodococcus sp. EPR-157]
MTSSTVVTGIGVAAPNGLGTQQYWEAVCNGTSGIDRIASFDATGYPLHLAGEVSNFEASVHLPSRLLPQTDRMTRLALTATDWALLDAGIEADTFDSLDMGVVTAASAGGFEFGQNELKKLWSQGNHHVSAYQSFAWFYAVNSGQISIRNNMRGPSGVVVSDQSGGLDAVAHARRQIRKGTKAVVTGGIDATICPWGWVALIASDRLSTNPDPASAYLPFDVRARGHVPGEGGAILVTEDAQQARDRGARIYGEIAGYGATFDGHERIAGSEGLIRAIEVALADAHVSTGDIDVVFADAAGDRSLDRSEADALRRLFGERGVPVTAPKTMTGRLYSGGAALDLATALLSIAEGVVPPTINTEPDSEFGLDLVTGSARAQVVRHALVLARGHHGFNSAVVARAA